MKTNELRRSFLPCLLAVLVGSCSLGLAQGAQTAMAMRAGPERSTGMAAGADRLHSEPTISSTGPRRPVFFDPDEYLPQLAATTAGPLTMEQRLQDFSESYQLDIDRFRRPDPPISRELRDLLAQARCDFDPVTFECRVSQPYALRVSTADALRQEREYLFRDRYTREMLEEWAR